jgi:hypothetical protein
MENASTPTAYLSGKLLKRPYVSNQIVGSTKPPKFLASSISKSPN